MSEGLTDPEGGASVMGAPNIDPVAMPPRREEKSRLEDAGEAGPVATDDVDVELKDQTLLLAKTANRIVELAGQKVLPSIPDVAERGAVLPGNPFKADGNFKYHHILFNEMTQAWKTIPALSATVAQAHKELKEATLKSYVKALGSLSGFTLKHDEPSDSYYLQVG
jgi:hypothetical protein